VSYFKGYSRLSWKKAFSFKIKHLKSLKYIYIYIYYFTHTHTRARAHARACTHIIYIPSNIQYLQESTRTSISCRGWTQV